jgi:MYXO-CTERM domain-containing protein
MSGVERRATFVAKMLRRSALAAAAGLGAFHLWLLGHQASTGQLADPGALGRWALAAALLVALFVLRRRSKLGSGRRAVAIWVLAAVLHGPALVNDHDGFATPAMPEAVVTVVTAAATIAALGASLLLLLRHTAWALGTAVGLLVAPDARLLPRRGPRRQLSFLPRPPPLA